MLEFHGYHSLQRKYFSNENFPICSIVCMYYDTDNAVNRFDAYAYSCATNKHVKTHGQVCLLSQCQM